MTMAETFENRIRTITKAAVEEMRPKIAMVIATELLHMTQPPHPDGPWAPPGSLTPEQVAANKKAIAEGLAQTDTCHIKGCYKRNRSKGYCAGHYQQARKYGWTMSPQFDMEKPKTPPRGRPPKAKKAA